MNYLFSRLSCNRKICTSNLVHLSRLPRKSDAYKNLLVLSVKTDNIMLIFTIKEIKHPVATTFSKHSWLSFLKDLFCCSAYKAGQGRNSPPSKKKID